MTEQTMRLANGDVLKVGDFGLTRGGDVILVEREVDNAGASFIAGGILYFSDGTFGYGEIFRDKDLDIVAKAVNPITLAAVSQLMADEPLLWSSLTTEQKGVIILGMLEDGYVVSYKG